MGRPLALPVFAALALGCVEPRTQLVLRVSSELPSGEGRALQSIVVRVRRGGSTGPLRSERALTLGEGGARRALPLRIGVLPAGDDLDTPVWFEVLGCAEPGGCERAVVSQRGSHPFTRGVTQEIDLGLYNSCRAARCTADEWCQQNGLCAPASQVPVRTLDGAGVAMPTDAAADAADATADADPGATQRSCQGAPAAPGCGVVEVPAGTITMGSGATPCPDLSNDSTTCLWEASPAVRDIRVSRFSIDRDEVTVARFRAFWDAGRPPPSGPAVYPGGTLPFVGAINTDEELRAVSGGGPPVWPSCNWNATDRDDHPMNCVGWATAQAFCAWDTPGGRLPTEAEWELAARGPEGRLYAWGDSAPDPSRACWSLPTERTTTCPVGSAGAGSTPRTSIRDLTGGVEEWLADYHRPYSDTGCWVSGRADPLCAVRSGERAHRGGSWGDNIVWYLRPGSRRSGGPQLRNNWVGFRCARSL